ncbi:MAG TPA: hypothetical protein VGS12_17375 [Caulobacteraceae bacterium]|nr:hypothetical protein [Caulobacteraceae bacterium]
MGLRLSFSSAMSRPSGLRRRGISFAEEKLIADLQATLGVPGIRRFARDI